MTSPASPSHTTNFSGLPEDEAPAAARIARHYNIRHHLRRVTSAEFLADLPRILDAMDQPSIDGVNTWYASKAAAEHGLKVVVSGVGADELLFGYTFFRQLPKLVACWQPASKLPGMMALAQVAASLQARRSSNTRWLHAPEWIRTIPGAWWLRRSLCSPEDLHSMPQSEISSGILRNFDPATWVQGMTGAPGTRPAARARPDRVHDLPAQPDSSRQRLGQHGPQRRIAHAASLTRTCCTSCRRSFRSSPISPASPCWRGRLEVRCRGRSPSGERPDLEFRSSSGSLAHARSDRRPDGPDGCIRPPAPTR